MAEEIMGNCLVLQSGEPTMISNTALAGIITEALNHECIEEIYGALNGMRGLLQEQIIDLADESQQAIRGLRFSPGAALGSSDFRLKSSADVDRLLKVLEAHDIAFLFICGGVDDMEMASRVSAAVAEAGMKTRVIGVPQAIDNSVPLTDHTPGYGSTAKYLSMIVRELACDAQSFARHDQVIVLEVPGQDAWLPAAASLAKLRNEPNSAPQLVFLPNVAFEANKFIENVAEVLKTESYCIIAVGESLVDENGNYMNFETKDGRTSEKGAGEYLEELVKTHVAGVNVKSVCMSDLPRIAAHWRSETDVDEALLTGISAVEAACNGTTGKMITLVRGDSDQYEAETGLADLAEVASAGRKVFNQNWVNESGSGLNFHFNKYAKALVLGEVEVPTEYGMPQYIGFKKNRVEVQLPPYVIE